MQQTQESAAGNLFEDAILEAMNTMTSTDVSFGNDTEAWKRASSCFVVVLMLAQTPAPKTRSNTTNDRDLIIVLFPRCHSFLFQPDRPQDPVHLP